MARSLKPTRKQGTTGVAGAAALLIIYIAGLFGQEVPPEVAGAAVLFFSWVAGYLVRERRNGRHEAVADDG